MTADGTNGSRIHRGPGRAWMTCAVLIGAAFVLLSGCGQRQTADLPAPPEDRRLVAATSLPEEVYRPLVLEYENRTGIFVQVEETDLAADGAADTGTDLYLGGSRFLLEDHAEVFTPEDGKESGEEDSTAVGAVVTWSSVCPVIIYNTRLIRISPPSGWENLLAPLWEKETAFADPLADDAALNALCTMAEMTEEDPWRLVQRFYRNLGGSTFASEEEVIQAVAAGDCNVGIASEDAALRARDDGEGIGIIYPLEGTCALPEGAGITAGAAHRDNAERFAAFLVTDDAQRYLTGVLRRRDAAGTAAGTEETHVRTDADTAARIRNHRNTVRSAWSSIMREGAQ